MKLKLSSGQSEIGHLVAFGYSNREISAELGITEQAVKSALHVIFNKIGCWNRVELANHFAKGDWSASRVKIPDTIASILITRELSRRAPRPVDNDATHLELQRLARYVCDRDTQGLVRALTEAALRSCRAGTSGLSVLDTAEDGSKVFRWDSLSGALAGAMGGCTPRDWSPCGVTLDLNSPQLFSRPEKVFKYFAEARPAIVEGLVLPLRMQDGSEFGTLWIASHSEDHQFTSTDVETMTSLCAFTLAAVRVLGMQPRVAPLENFMATRPAA